MEFTYFAVLVGGSDFGYGVLEACSFGKTAKHSGGIESTTTTDFVRADSIESTDSNSCDFDRLGLLDRTVTASNDELGLKSNELLSSCDSLETVPLIIADAEAGVGGGVEGKSESEAFCEP